MEPAIRLKVTEPTLRPIDLARRAGVSVQTVRRYEKARVLPEAKRLPGGHRRFTTHHLSALIAMTQFRAAHGHGLAVRIMAHIAKGEIGEAVIILDEAHAAIHRDRQRVHAVRRMIEESHQLSRSESARALRIGEFCQQVQVPLSTARFWEQRGLIHPVREPGSGYRIFGSRELRRAAFIQAMREAGFHFEEVERVLNAIDADRREDALPVVLEALQRLAYRSAMSWRAACSALRRSELERESRPPRASTADFVAAP